MPKFEIFQNLGYNMYVKTRKEVVKTMGKYEVVVNVKWGNVFIVNAENKEEAAEKAKQAMDELMEYNITYDMENEDAEWHGGWDTITVEETHECNEEE